MTENDIQLLSFLGKKRKNENSAKNSTKNSPIRISNSSKKNKNVNNVFNTLNILVNKYGFDSVLNSLSKYDPNSKNKLDISINKLKETYAEDTDELLPILLIRMLFTYFDQKDKEKDKKIEKLEKIQQKQEKQEKNKISEISKIIEKNSKNSKKTTKSVEKVNTKIDNTNIINLSSSPIKSNVIPVTIEPKSKKKEKNNEKNDNTNTNVIHLVEEEKLIKNEKKEKNEKKNNMSIGSHYNKGDNGLIYRYQVFKLDGKGNAIFKCYDDKCVGEGIYDLNSKTFNVIKEHDMKHKEHDYILRCDKNDEKVFKEMNKTNKNDAQVFKEGNERTVKMY